MCVNNLPKVVIWKLKIASRSHDLLSLRSRALTITPSLISDSLEWSGDFILMYGRRDICLSGVVRNVDFKNFFLLYNSFMKSHSDILVCDWCWQVCTSMCVCFFACRAGGKVKHCRIKHEDRLFTIGSAEFESMSELVEYYKKNPLYRKVKLRYAVTEQMLAQHGRVCYFSLVETYCRGMLLTMLVYIFKNWVGMEAVLSISQVLSSPFLPASWLYPHRHSTQSLQAAIMMLAYWTLVYYIWHCLDHPTYALVRGHPAPQALCLFSRVDSELHSLNIWQPLKWSDVI